MGTFGLSKPIIAMLCYVIFLFYNTQLQKTSVRHGAQSRKMQRGTSGARGTSNVLINDKEKKDY